MGYQGSSLKRDTQELARQTGAGAGAFFWGTIAAVAFVFWPSIFVSGPHRLTAEILWYSFLGAVTLFVVIAAGMANAPKDPPRPKTGVPLTPPPSRPWLPDLRESGVFEGKR